jgi:hypothetical protein
MALDECGVGSGAAEPVIFENAPQAADFDSWMQAYPCVLTDGDDLVMFYNGDGFGVGGFGWARCLGAARS